MKRLFIVFLALLTCGFTLTPLPDRSIAVLLFHQVSETPIESAMGVDHVQKPWTSPAAFTALLDTLQQQGYTVVPLRTALDFIEGKIDQTQLPAKPLLITFDDGYESAWTTATPILRAHHATATMFFEGHATDNPAIPGRLSSREIAAMARSGVWTLESHGWMGHSNLRIDANGTLSPYWYANLAWLPAQHRSETPNEFEARVESDLRRMRAQYALIAGSPMTVFAFPSGEFGQNVALASGANPLTLLEAGHSNAPGLQAMLEKALADAGYEAAFAVSLPVSSHFASRADDIWTLPRLGVGATFDVAFLDTLAGYEGVELPEVANGQFADAGPLCVRAGRRYVASTNQPVVYELDASGRRIASFDFPALLDGRPSGHAAISGLACTADVMYAVQQAGFDPHPVPQLDRFSFDAMGAPHLVTQTPLPPSMNWLVGIAFDRDVLYGSDDRGALFDVLNKRAIGTFAAPATARFAGLAQHQGLLFTLERTENVLDAFTTDGKPAGTAPIDAGVHDLGFDDDTLLVSHWTNNRRAIRRYHLEVSPQ